VAVDAPIKSLATAVERLRVEPELTFQQDFPGGGDMSQPTTEMISLWTVQVSI
jgi:hypothetical protein